MKTINLDVLKGKTRILLRSPSFMSREVNVADDEFVDYVLELQDKIIVIQDILERASTFTTRGPAFELTPKETVALWPERKQREKLKEELLARRTGRASKKTLPRKQKKTD